VRQEDTIARLGGDEFVVLVESLPGRRGLVTVREKIARALSAPYTVNGKTINVTVSIGASQFPEDGQDTHTLLQKADFAMYRWKEYHRTS
jgi:diguanylate cyclase (GGDEF)-like protein